MISRLRWWLGIPSWRDRAHCDEALAEYLARAQEHGLRSMPVLYFLGRQDKEPHGKELRRLVRIFEERHGL